MLIKSPDELIPFLSNVRPVPPWRGFEYTADPPCHASQSKRSFHFGRDEAGYLQVTCWNNCRLEDIERALGTGITLQIRYPRTGNLRLPPPDGRDEIAGTPARYSPVSVPADPDEWEWRAPDELPAPPPFRRPRTDERKSLPAVPADGRRITIADLRAVPRWFPADGKMGWHGRDGCWRHIIAAGLLDESIDRVRAAAKGCSVPDPRRPGTVRRVYPQMPFERIEDALEWLEFPPGVRPAISLAGSPDFPFPFPLLVIDADYKPDADDAPDYPGRSARDALRNALERIGAPVFPSSSGNGFHALLLLDDADLSGWIRAGRHPVPSIHRSLSFDVFPPGAPALVALRIAAADYPPDFPLPTIKWDFLFLPPPPEPPSPANAPLAAPPPTSYESFPDLPVFEAEVEAFVPVPPPPLPQDANRLFKKNSQPETEPEPIRPPLPPPLPVPGYIPPSGIHLCRECGDPVTPPMGTHYQTVHCYSAAEWMRLRSELLSPIPGAAP